MHLPLGGFSFSQAQRDVAGLALCALGLFMAFVLYGHWDGGGVGDALATALGFAVGRARWLVPALLLACGVAMVLRPALPEHRPLRAGCLCLAAAVLLALAAGLLGLSPAPLHAVKHIPGRVGPAASASHRSEWAAGYLEARGGILGQALWWAAHALVRDLGVATLVAFMTLAGISLLSGASLVAIARSAARALVLVLRAPLVVAHKLGGHVRVPLPGALRLVIADETLREPSLDASIPAAASTASPFQPAEVPSPDYYGEGQQPHRDPRESRWSDAQEWRAGSAEPWRATGVQRDSAPDTVAGKAGLTLRATHVEGPPVDELGDGERASQAPARREHVWERNDAAPRDQQARGQASSQESQRAAAEPAVGGRLTPQGRVRGVVSEDPAFSWKLPQASNVLVRSGASGTTADAGTARGRRSPAEPPADRSGQERVAAALLEALGHFGVQAKLIGTVMGPHITRYELRLAPGTKVAKVAQLKDDLAYALAATDIRILAPIPGKQAVGVEVPNARRRIVRLGDVFQQPPPEWSPLTVWLGKDVAGKAIGADLARMPHLLVAGATGSGKSGAINAMLSSVLLRATPRDVRLVLVDPKQVELNHYESIPHLLTPVITSPRMAANALANLVREMEQRYGIMSLARTRTLPELNEVRGRGGEAPLPYILCVIDELADLMMVAPADVEDSIIRLAQKARAVGIHLVLATQSPRVDVITGMIKANVPSRIAFAVSSQTDSRVILDQNGAETLLGQGDMLFGPMGSSKLQRIQGAYIDEQQIAKIADLWRWQGEPELREELLQQVESEQGKEGSEDELDPDRDPLLGEAITLVAEMQTASTSMMQRRLRIGYTRAGRLIDMLERRGVISGYEGSKPRQVLISEAELPRVLAALGEARVHHDRGPARTSPTGSGIDRSPEVPVSASGDPALEELDAE
jgi:S-DNA-T family DNA segregation ATPase FtsK/SpoIIIE